MKKLIGFSIGVFAISFAAQATVETFKVKGMHCKGCVESMQGEVCDADYKTCTVDLAKGEKNTGVISVEAANGKKIDVAALAIKVKKAGDDYELIPAAAKPTKTSKPAAPKP